jgi:hypothetical protein
MDRSCDGRLGRQPAQVSEGEERFGADHDGEAALELLELGRFGYGHGVVQRAQRLVDQAEAASRPQRGDRRLGDGRRDHRPHRPLIGQHLAEQDLSGEADALNRVGAVGHRFHRLLRAVPDAGQHLTQQRGKVREVPVRGRL